MVELSIRDKRMLVAGIKDSYQLAKDAWATAIEQSIACGGELVYCKSQIEHGRWLAFLEACEIPQRTASGMMRMHEHRDLLREKSAVTWVDAMRIVQEQENPNRQRIADLTLAKPVETVDAIASDPIEPVAPTRENPIVTEQPASVPDEPQSEVPSSPKSPASPELLEQAARTIHEALHKRISPGLPPDEQARMEAIESAVDLIGSLDDSEAECFAELVTRRVKHDKVSSLVRIMSVAVTIPDLIDLLFDEFDGEDDGATKDGYVDNFLKKLSP